MPGMAFVTGGHPGLRTTYAQLMSSCVTVETRLDPSLNAGIFPANLIGKDEYEGDLRKVPCTKGENHVACDQIFPLLKHPNWRTPTVKHNCPRTVTAAALRACSNRVGYDPKVFEKFSRWFRGSFIPSFIKCMDEELVNVDLDEWLNEGRYSLAYRQKLRDSLKPDKADDPIKYYESFPKIEQQFTTVPHEDKETPLNDVKERQICGPTDMKKVFANAFINKLEGIAHKYFKPYCGRQNWMEICTSVEEKMNEIKRILLGAADGSGFDMSQLEGLNKLMNELIRACAEHPNVHWNEPLNMADCMRALEESLILNVKCDKGKLQYTAQGRASGDGWTTFGNTMLMIAYWQYTYYIAGIEEYLLKVKGDDVLLGHSLDDQEKFLVAVKVVFTDKKDYHNHGLAQVCKKIDFGDITDLDFLSNHFFWTGKDRLRMTRIPARVIQTLSWTTKLPHTSKVDKLENSRRELLYSKGSCLLAWGRGLPIWEVLAKKMMELGRPGRLSEFNQYADGSRVWNGNEDRAAYLLYLEERYGLTPVEVGNIEEEISKITSLEGELFIPALEKLYT